MNELPINLTKEEAIKRHRIMWYWIAFETLKQKRCIGKIEAFEYFGWGEEAVPHLCWCCAYTKKREGGYHSCLLCPIEWPDSLGCATIHGLYRKWVYEANYEIAADLALQIATLPERSY